MDIAGSRALVWRVLTDYENLQRFVPGMQSSRIVSGRGEPLLLEQKGESGVLFFKLTTTTVSRIFETPESEIRFDLVSGNLKRMQGSWTLTPHDHAISVGYRAELVPEFDVPPLIGPAVMAQNVKAMVEGVALEIGRRRLASTKE
jgi:ribosome-associated toxin RatA of RatAB toxin-antitoxin module